MRGLRFLGGLSIAWLLGGAAAAVTIPGGGPKRSDCFVVLMANGAAFPAGARTKGTTCADGDLCDGDGMRDGACLFTPLVCLNASESGLSSCTLAEVAAITFKGKRGLDTSAFAAAAAGLGLPSSASACSGPLELRVAVGGPNERGELVRGTATVKAKARTSKGPDKDTFRFVCLPSTDLPPSTSSTSTSSSTSTTTTTAAGAPTTTLPAGPGLTAEITAASIDAAGTVTVTLRVTDAAGTALTPRTSATTNPNQARVRLTIARLEVVPETAEGVTTTFTRYRNYVVGPAEGGSQPTYDTTGTYALADAAAGTWTYTFGTVLPADLDRTLTHTVGAQVERTFQGARLVANPLRSFVPDGSVVSTVREVTTTAQCNACHDPLSAHGGGRREVGLCQLCHTDQAVDPDSGNEIDLKNMVHRIHTGKDLPSVTGGPVGATYSIVGFQGAEAIYARKVNVCASGSLESVPCASDADCEGGSCSATATVGVGFPRDVRSCATCHADGATAADHLSLPSTRACVGCHDDANPGEESFGGLDPGEGHPTAGAQPEALCRLCHTDAQGEEFDITVPGAHVIPARSATLAGLEGEILDAAGAPGGPVTITFRVRSGGTPVASFAGFNRVAFAISGPTTDFGGASIPLLTPIAVGGGASGMLVGPDGSGVFTYVTSATLPADAAGTWRVGLEARRAIPVNGADVSEALPNPVLDFSVDGSPVVARRTVVDGEKCASCHGTFSLDLSIHGNLRNRVEYCVVCHNPNVTDFARRANAVATGADPQTAPIGFKQMIHKIHRGEELERRPYLVYGFGGAPKNYTAHDFGEVRFPGDLRDCETCHAGGSQLLPLPTGVLPTIESVVSGGMEQPTGQTLPITDACTSCHDSGAVAAHAETNTTAGGVETCAVCHGEGAPQAVSVVHAPEP